MGEQWLIQEMGEVIGPLSGDQLRSMAKSGRIDAFTPIQRVGQNRWYNASNIKGLLPESQYTPAVASIPAPQPKQRPSIAFATAVSPPRRAVDDRQPNGLPVQWWMVSAVASLVACSGVFMQWSHLGLGGPITGLDLGTKWHVVAILGSLVASVLCSILPLRGVAKPIASASMCLIAGGFACYHYVRMSNAMSEYLSRSSQLALDVFTTRGGGMKFGLPMIVIFSLIAIAASIYGIRQTAKD